MRIVADLEANGLKPSKIHCLVAKDIDTGEVHDFLDFGDDFRRFSSNVSCWVGHNFLGYDRPVLANLGLVDILWSSVTDTLVLSRLFDATLDGHSLEAWGRRLGFPKVGAEIKDWETFTPEMLARCRGDVEINFLLFKKFEPYLNSERWKSAIRTEHFIADQTTKLTKNGMGFALKKSLLLKETILKDLKDIDKELKKSFLPKVVLRREVLPRATKFGTIAKNSIPKVLGSDLSAYTPDCPFSLIEYVPFNPGSPKQIVERLNSAGWRPYEKTKGYRDAEKALRTLRRLPKHHPTRQSEITAVEARLGEYAVSGWSISEENLKTLPDTAPKAAQELARRLMLANRVSTLNQWIEACVNDRIHGSFNGIGAWTQRMSHDRPNMGNIPKYDDKQPHKTPYSDQMRALWGHTVGRYLVGVDAESIQLRIFGHYIQDQGFINALVAGKKEDGTDPHSLNQVALGSICRSRDAAKTFIYAWLLGAGRGKVAQILGCSMQEAERANDNFLEFYPGLKELKTKIAPRDAARGYFEGFDGRYVKIWGKDEDERKHFVLAGYLQNGEVIIMKRAAEIWVPKLEKEGVPFWWVNFVHDEYQTETIRDMEVAMFVAKTQADAIRQVGVDLGLRCPMAGSILNSHGKLAIGDNWMETH